MKFPTNSVARVLVVGVLIFATWQPALASTGTIDATNHYAWSDNGGWVNWSPSNGNVTVTDTAVTGYIWSADFGWINLAPTNGGVTNDGSGNLGGWAWGQSTGWINFSGVSIDANGTFHGTTVMQSIFGTMNFDCTNCKVVTSWRKTSGTNTNATPSSGGNGPIIGSLGQPQNQSTSQTNATSSANSLPPTLTPTSTPPKTQPSSKPPSSSKHTATARSVSRQSSSALATNPRPSVSQVSEQSQEANQGQATVGSQPANATPAASITEEPSQIPASSCTSFLSCIVQAVVGFFAGIFGH